MKSLELEAEELKLALTQIMMICEQSLAEKVGKEEADRSLGGFEETRLAKSRPRYRHPPG